VLVFKNSILMNEAMRIWRLTLAHANNHTFAKEIEDSNIWQSMQLPKKL